MPAINKEANLAPTTAAILGKSREVAATAPGGLSVSPQHRIFEGQLLRLAELGITTPSGSDVRTGIGDGRRYQRWFFPVNEEPEKVRGIVAHDNLGTSGMTGGLEVTLIDGPVNLPRGQVNITPILNREK